MSLTIGWWEIALRLALTVVAGALLGINRTEHGHAAGLRTTLLVCLAASFSMIQVNLLLPLTGKTGSSFSVLDLMRLPLGILTGMGFIGAGAIVRKGNLVHGLTTAATLWFITVLGLCFGGGQLALGLIGLILGLFVLETAKRFERGWKQDRRATLIVTAGADGPTEAELASLLRTEGYVVGPWAFVYHEEGRLSQMTSNLRWRGRVSEINTPEFLKGLLKREGVIRLEWKP